MIRGLYTAASGLIVGETRQGIITNNLANANTIGFKSDNLSVKNFGEVLVYNYDKTLGNKNIRQNLGNISRGSGIDTVNTFFTQGPLQNTERDTDFAIQGRGFFTVNRNGKQYYTRDGHFNVDINGDLVNSTGDLVQGINLYNGSLESIHVGDGKISSDSKGNISINGVQKYKFNMADFQNYQGLKKVGDNLYEGNGAQTAVNYSIRHKYIEKSNVNVISQAVDMMTNMRSFESNQKLVQVMDETLNKAANELGAVR